MERNVIEQFKIGKYIGKIYEDPDPESPDDWGDKERFLVFQHRQFCVEREGFNPEEIFHNNGKCKGFHVFVCYAYIHSGVALSVGSHNFPDARWDVSSTGYFLIKREAGTWTKKQALEAAESLCSDWNTYLSGEVYMYEISEQSEDESEIVESCRGYYGLESCLSDAKSIVESLLKNTK